MSKIPTVAQLRQVWLAREQFTDFELMLEGQRFDEWVALVKELAVIEAGRTWNVKP